MLEISKSFVGRLEMNGMCPKLQSEFSKSDSLARELVVSAQLICLRRFFAKDNFFDDFVKKSILWLSKETKNFERDVWVKIPISFEKIFKAFNCQINRFDAMWNSIGNGGYFRSFGQDETELFLCFVKDLMSGYKDGIKIEFKKGEIKKEYFLF